MFPFARIPLRKAAVSLSAFALMISADAVRAQVTSDVQLDYQTTTGGVISMVSPRGIAVAPDGTVYVADVESGSTGQVFMLSSNGLVSGTSGGAGYLGATVTALKFPGKTNPVNPTALAVDSNGVLYIADPAGFQVLEVANPAKNGALKASQVSYGVGIGSETPSALAVDASNNLYIADATQHAIYEVSGGTVMKLPITPTNLNPVGLAVDASGNVYFADSSGNEIYKYTASTASTAVFLSHPSSGSFKFGSATTGLPIGMGFDPAGNLYVMDSAANSLWEINAAATSSYRVAIRATITNSASMTINSAGNILFTDDDSSNPGAHQVWYNGNPVNFGTVAGGKTSPYVYANFFFNSGAIAPKAFEDVQGDTTSEYASTGTTTCTTGSLGTAGADCTMQFDATYLSSNPGLRQGVWGLKDGAGKLYVVPAIGISQAADLALYPGVQVTVPQPGSGTPWYEPQGLAVTGNGGTLFVADEGGIFITNPATYQHGTVWAYTNGVGTPANVGTFTTPIAVAVDRGGNLYVADYQPTGSSVGTVTKIAPFVANNGTVTWPSFGTQLSFPASAALNHPMALAFDPSGNLYIGDMGPAGTGANAGNPGYIVEVPANGGTPVKLNYAIGGAPVIFPQALATDFYGNLYIADGGDGQTNMGQVDVVTASAGTVSSTSSISAMSFGETLDSPSGLSVDAAGDLYILDGYNQRVLEAQIGYTGTTPSPTPTAALLGLGTSGFTSVLVTPTNLVVWPNGQYITVTDIGYQQPAGGGGVNVSPAQVLTLQSKNAVVTATPSSGGAVNGVNVGNEQATFNAPGEVLGTGQGTFTLSGCGSNGTTLVPGLNNICETQIFYNASGTQTNTATFTLNGNVAADNSALGNQISVTGKPNVPVGQLSAFTPALTGQTQTVTLTNIGTGFLFIYGWSLSNNSAIVSGGTCNTSQPVPGGGSCTLVVTFSPACFVTDTLTINDNNDGIANPQQTQSATATYFNLLACFGLATPVGGPGIGGGTLGNFGSNKSHTGIPHAAGVVGAAGVQSAGSGVTLNSNRQSSTPEQSDSTVQMNNAVQPPSLVVPLGMLQPSGDNFNGTPDANSGADTQNTVDSSNSDQTNTPKKDKAVKQNDAAPGQQL